MQTTDEQWLVDQQRRHNLASFAHPLPAPRIRRPLPVFTLEELIIAERVELKSREAA